jgi:hypothetical protein
MVNKFNELDDNADSMEGVNCYAAMIKLLKQIEINTRK